MKMSLNIVAPTLEGIRKALKELSEAYLNSNEFGETYGYTYDYSFVDSDNVFSDNSDVMVINPNNKN